MQVHFWNYIILTIFTELGSYTVSSRVIEKSNNELNDNVEFISTTNDELLTLQCPRNGSDITWKYLNPNKDLNGETIKNHSSTYELDGSLQTIRSIYGCFINDSILIKKFYISVFEAPHFVKNMHKSVVRLTGNTARLNCKAAGVPTPNITWYKDDKSLPTRKLDDIKNNHWSLTLEDLVPNDNGNYTCHVCNNVGCIHFTFAVDVVERYNNSPILTAGLEDKTVAVGDNVQLSCEFLSDSQPFIAWTKTLYKFDNFFNCSFEDVTKCHAILLQKSDYGKMNADRYEINNVTQSDEGWYACFASNSLGTTVSKAYLTVVDEQPGKKY